MPCYLKAVLFLTISVIMVSFFVYIFAEISNIHKSLCVCVLFLFGDKNKFLHFLQDLLINSFRPVSSYPVWTHFLSTVLLFHIIFSDLLLIGWCCQYRKWYKHWTPWYTYKYAKCAWKEKLGEGKMEVKEMQIFFQMCK